MRNRRGWRLIVATIALGLSIGGTAQAQSTQQPPPPMPPPPPPIPQPAPPHPAQEQGKHGKAKGWRDSLADSMLWEGGGDWAVGHVVKDPLTTGFGNPDYLEPPDSLTADQVTSQTASIEKPR